VIIRFFIQNKFKSIEKAGASHPEVAEGSSGSIENIFPAAGFKD
jgi:hypothetical protein